jgi:MSHA biogenesis protein MshJ
MKRWWEVQSVRINALSLRERIFLFLSIMACSVAVVDVIWLSPAKLSHKLLLQRFEKQSADLQRTREALKQVAQPVDSGKTVRNELTAVQTSLATLNQSINAVLPVQTEVTPLAQVLVHLLRRHEGLTLLHTAVLAAEVISVKTKSTQGGGAVALPVNFTRQGVELKVAGPYPELMRYVQALEKAMPEIRWGAMTLKSDAGQSELSLQLYLLGVSS